MKKNRTKMRRTRVREYPVARGLERISMLNRLKDGGSCKSTGKEQLRFSATEESMTQGLCGVAGEWNALVSLRRRVLIVIIDIPSHCPLLN